MSLTVKEQVELEMRKEERPSVNELIAQFAVGALLKFQVERSLCLIARYSKDHSELIKIFWIVMDSETVIDKWSLKIALEANEYLDDNLRKYIFPKNNIKEIPAIIYEKYPKE